jgi:hypothetical protein
MSKNGESKPPGVEEDSDQATAGPEDVHITVVSARARATSRATVEILNRAETEFEGRERATTRVSLAATMVGIVSAALSILTGFVKDLSLGWAAGVAVALAIAVTFGLSALVLDRAIISTFVLCRPESDLPSGLRGLRDELAVERRDALAALPGASF